MKTWLTYNHNQNSPIPQEAGHVEQQEKYEENILLRPVMRQTQKNELIHLCLVLHHHTNAKERWTGCQWFHGGLKMSASFAWMRWVNLYLSFSIHSSHFSIRSTQKKLCEVDKVESESWAKFPQDTSNCNTTHLLLFHAKAYALLLSDNPRILQWYCQLLGKAFPGRSSRFIFKAGIQTPSLENSTDLGQLGQLF